VLLALAATGDPELPMLIARAGVAVVVPAHLSQPGWLYQVGCAANARLVTSKGILMASQLSGVLTRTARASPAELPHIDSDDREYVASEMTAFLAALLNELPCPLFNPPAPNCLWGPSWPRDRWARMAAAEGLPVCRSLDDCDGHVARVVALAGRLVRGGSTIPPSMERPLCRVAERAGVVLLEGLFCERHLAFQNASLRPDLDEGLLDQIEHECRRRPRAS
jgi:hypothetical protein